MNLPLFDQSTGYTLLLVYGLVAFALTYWYSRGYDNNKTSFLVARRELNTFQGSMSVAAAWLWAPGLFISTQQAYVNGLVGHFWFCLGNFLTLGFFAYFAHRLRQQFPDGFQVMSCRVPGGTFPYHDCMHARARPAEALTRARAVWIGWVGRLRRPR